MHTTTTRRQLVLGAAAGLALPRPALAQAFPAQPIKYICPWPAGGSTDAVMRAIADSAGRALGQKVIVENKPGAGGMLGANELVSARPDGYTLAQVPHGAFLRKTLDDPAVMATFDKYDQTVIYMDTDTYTKWARDTYAAERATIERLGMAKGS